MDPVLLVAINSWINAGIDWPTVCSALSIWVGQVLGHFEPDPTRRAELLATFTAGMQTMADDVATNGRARFFVDGPERTQ